MHQLHGLLDDGNEMLTQLHEINLSAQTGTESCQGPSGIILTAIEAVVQSGPGYDGAGVGRGLR